MEETAGTREAPIGRLPQATVIGASEADGEMSRAAEGVGRLLARLEWAVVIGGRGGVMDATSRGAVEAGGLTIGIF